MHKVLKIIIIICGFLFTLKSFADAPLLLGAGATFPYPLYAKWAQEYQKQTGVKLNYQSIGSGGGIKQIQAKTVDFGASDQPLSSADLNTKDLIQFPTVVGGVVPVINLPGINPGQLKLSGQVLADIYLGKIKKWNDEAIKTLNPTLTLPEQLITVVHRSDGSGTTYLFTNYLSKISNQWKSQVGNNVSVDWPVGIGGKGNEGVAAFVQNIKGAIGYLEFAYAEQGKISFIQLQNKSGIFVIPSLKSFQAVANNADWENAPHFAVILTDQEGNDSWPITGATFILMRSSQAKPEHGKAVLQFFAWAFDNGKEMAMQLDYVPLPEKAVKLIKTMWQEKIKDTSGKSIWP
jgi:phosphate transport system substrate-binding protein